MPSQELTLIVWREQLRAKPHLLRQYTSRWTMALFLSEALWLGWLIGRFL